MPFGASRLAYLAKTAAAAAGRNISITANGDAQIDTAQSKFGGASGLFDGVDDSLTIGPSDGFIITGDFTIEFFARLNDINNSQIILSNRPTTGYSATQFYIQALDSGSNFAVSWGIQSLAATTTAYSYSYSTWNHIALVRSGTTVQLYVNGTAAGVSRTYSGDVGDASNKTLYLGILGSILDFSGHIDELRISDTARYTGTFTPTTSAFTNDANTLLLMHMDGTDGSTTFTDDDA